MLRPMTSSVSALSGIVANGHQAIHFVSSAPSKIPYGGFSPVRLQTRLRPRPPSRTRRRALIGRHCRYLRSRRFLRSGSVDQPAPSASDHDRESSGPWLPNRLYCPVGSSLTMATSAPLRATRRLMDYSTRLRVRPASLRGSPIYSASPFIPCRRPYSGDPRVRSRRPLGRGCCLRHLRIGSAITTPANPNHAGCVTKLQRSLNATAWQCCLPCFGQGSYDRAFTGRVAPDARVGYNWMARRHVYHRRTFTGWTGSLMGCERRNAEEKSFFFHLSLRPSANLCVSALILRSLRANRDIAKERNQLWKIL